jgi:hypothetical protein
MKVGELIVLPAVRRAPKDTLLVADGFSCREQIAQATDRRALHMAEVLHMAMREGPSGRLGNYPERSCVLDYAEDARVDARRVLAAAAVGAAIVGCVALGRSIGHFLKCTPTSRPI